MEKINQLYNEWLSLQPLQVKDRKRLDDKFRLEFNYNSNHIEGNTLSYGQTELLLLFGETSGSAKLRDYEEMKAHNIGLELMKQEAEDKQRPLTENFIRNLNLTILVQDYWKNARTPDGQNIRMFVKTGTYKTRPNSVVTVTGEIFDYAAPEETPSFMTSLVEWYNVVSEKSEMSPLQLAALLHYRYIRIHPFEDGNGRIARLLTNFVLHRCEYPMIVVQTKDKDRYLSVLHQCDVEVGLMPSDGANAPLNKIRPFVDYLESCLIHSLEVSIKAAKGESIEEEDDFDKRLTLLDRKLQQKMKQEKKYISEEEVRKVLGAVYFPLVSQFDKAIISLSNQWFCYLTKSTRLSKSTCAEGGLNVGPDLRNAEDYIREAKSVWFNCHITSPKKEKKEVLGQLEIKLSFHILFLKDKYHIADFCEKDFAYGEVPSKEEMDTITSLFKQVLTEPVEKAIHKMDE
ncbi:MAG: Fic family protein [Bacteroidales bacterium]|nr:Fic family protein [Bacteroidales bacterium]